MNTFILSWHAGMVEVYFWKQFGSQPCSRCISVLNRSQLSMMFISQLKLQSPCLNLLTLSKFAWGNRRVIFSSHWGILMHLSQELYIHPQIMSNTLVLLPRMPLGCNQDLSYKETSTLTTRFILNLEWQSLSPAVFSHSSTEHFLNSIPVFLNKLKPNWVASRTTHIRCFLMNMEGFSKPPCHTATVFCAHLINTEWKQLGGGR